MLPFFESVINFTDVRAFLAIAIKHKRLMLLCMVLGLCVGLAYMVYKRPVFYSRALVQVTHYAPLPVDEQVLFQDTSLRSIIAELNAPHIMERTAASLGLNVSYETLMEKYIKKQRLRANSEGDLRIDLWPWSYELAKEWPEALMREYQAYRDEKRFERRERMISRYTKELMQVRERMEAFAQEKAGFRKAKRLDANQRMLNELSHVPNRLQTIHKKLDILKPVRKRLENEELSPVQALSLLSSTKDEVKQISVGAVIPMNPGATNAYGGSDQSIIVTPDLVSKEHWEALDKKRRRVLKELEEAQKIYLPAHSRIQALKKQLAAINKELALELEMKRRQFELEYASLVEDKDRLNKQFNELRELLRTNEALKREFNRMQASTLSWDTMYKRIAERLEQIDFGFGKERVELQFRGLTELRHIPVSPYRRKVFVYALGLGLAMAVAGPFLLEYLDDTISVDEQVHRRLGLPSIGIVPKNDALPSERIDPTIIADSRRHPQLIEYFRVIRVNILSNVHFQGKRQVILVGSALPKEGKSIVALNLALSFARLGDRTLLIDGDLRRGSLHRVLDKSSRPGFGQLLRDGVTLNEVTVDTFEPNLRFIPSGRHVHSASELLESGHFAQVLTDLRSGYDRIIIDTPPILGLAETPSMAKLADGVLYVIWSGGTPLKAIQTAKSMLDANGVQFFGCVLNKLDLSSATAYYYYYYYSYRYYQAYQSDGDGSGRRRSPWQQWLRRHAAAHEASKSHPTRDPGDTDGMT